MIRFVVPGEPRSKARPRFTTRNGRSIVYTPKSTLSAEQDMATAFRVAAGAYEVPVDDAFRVVAEFHHGGMHRRDVDNMLKAVLDGLNGVAWVDDAQVTELTGRKVPAGANGPQTVVTVENLGPRERPRKKCERCGTLFNTYKSWSATRRFCSQACVDAGHASKQPRTCPQCGGTFTWAQTSKRQKHCSRACAVAARTRRVQ